jgi:FkbM family methyltransferase
MLFEVLRAYSRLPGFRGKTRIGQRLFQISQPPARALQSMSDGFQMDLALQDRMQRSMFLNRRHEPETEQAFKSFIAKSKVFVDVGANIGYFSLAAKALNPRLQVFAFEPLPGNAENLRRNIELNHFKQIEVIEECLSDQAGTTEFMVPPGDECGWGRIAYRDLFSGQKISRPMTTLDQFYTGRNLPIDLLKVDVEGFEMNVFKGAKKVLSELKPVICFEANEPCLKDVGTSSQELFDFLKSHGYKTHSINPNGTLTPATTPLPNYRCGNYFAVPKK